MTVLNRRISKPMSELLHEQRLLATQLHPAEVHSDSTASAAGWMPLSAGRQLGPPGGGDSGVLALNFKLRSSGCESHALQSHEPRGSEPIAIRVSSIVCCQEPAFASRESAGIQSRPPRSNDPPSFVKNGARHGCNGGDGNEPEEHQLSGRRKREVNQRKWIILMPVATSRSK